MLELGIIILIIIEIKSPNRRTISRADPSGFQGLTPLDSLSVGLQIQVHGLGDMHAGDALTAEVHDNASGIVSAAYYQRINAELLQPVFYPRREFRKGI